MNTASKPAKTTKPIVRCAIYTRKSSEEGLDQEFNSLDAQRVAAEAYIASQQHEGWRLHPERYDDGGFTGGNMERPALTRLMNDIAAGRVQCVVVYKVDRLSRSLLDFARMMAIFDERQVAFVSVTQQFNTATSMGRLVLNVLLSFAQFEREIIGERTRDKIAATRRRGQWTGGPPLGYDLDPHNGRLVINAAEAERVRTIFALYLELGALVPVVLELERRGWSNKAWTTRKGTPRGGHAFTRSTLGALLSNVLLVGQVPYKAEVHSGLHPAIVDRALWQQVQDRLADQRVKGSDHQPNRYGATLMGLLRCHHCDCAMTPSTVKRGVRCYRFYVCGRAQARGRDVCPHPSLSAARIEEQAWQQIVACADAPSLPAEVRDHIRTLAERWPASPPAERADGLRRLIERIDHDGDRATLAITFRDPTSETMASYAEDPTHLDKAPLPCPA